MKKFFTLLFIIFSFSLSLFGKDSTATIVGPGFKYHSIYKTVGPNNIKVLEIDLSNPKNKIETALAKDVLGTGFEKTSSMASRKSKPGHLVIGAVNGDFFGISAPTNPYTFLSGSMIMNSEYTQGHTSKSYVFGVKKNTKTSPLLENLGFSGKVYAINDSTYNLSGVNDTRDDNEMLLYNRFIGTNSLTNSFGSEVRLKPLNTFAPNSTKKFLVTQKIANVGNMAINGDEYILSGHGTAQVFIDNYISVGDTIRVLIGSSPNKGDIACLLGGNVVLVKDGVVPTFTNTDVHPRTAVGFNQDSTKVFFVTVDGRQAGFSVGMNYEQLGNLMKELGCYQALNVDGGGSTSMVVRGSIKNSPSDAGGERSVANALLAVCLAPMDELIDSLKLTPKSIIIDSTQSKTINVNGVDKWGFQIEVDPNDVTWEIHGITGRVDSLGVFYPTSTGTGYVVGRIGTMVDTVVITIIKNKIPTWSYSAIGGNLPTWFSPSDNTIRGLGYGYVNGNHRVYIVPRPYVFILDAATGDKVGELPITGVAGGTYTLNDIDVTDDGVIFACNLTTNPSTSAFKVYKWSSETATPEAVFSFSGTTYRMGDKFTVVGDYSQGTATIYAVGQISNKAWRWTMTGGVFNTTPTEITFSDISSCGSAPSIAPEAPGVSKFFLNAHSLYPKYYNANGTIISTMPSTIISSSNNAIRYFEKAGRKFLATYMYGFGNENAKILDISKGFTNAEVIETTPTLGNNANNIALTGDVSIRHYSNNTVIIYVLACNNGFGAYSLIFDTTTSVTENNTLPTQYSLSQNYPNPFNPSTNINYQLPTNNLVTVKIYDILGRVVEILVNEIQDAGIYTARWDASNASAGTYFYELKCGEFRSIKKMILIK